MEQVLQGETINFLAEFGMKGRMVAMQNYGFFDAQRNQAVVLSVDVTEAHEQKKQLQAEKNFTQSLLENSVDGIVAISREGHITAWNTQAARFFGHEAAAVLGRPLFEVLPELNCDETHDVLSRVLSGELVVLSGQSFAHRPGRYDAYHVPLREEGEITGVLVMFRDVTERDRQAEEATQLRLRQQQEVLSAILSTQEVERKRIAEALHNGLGQLLYAAKLNLEGRAGTPASPRASLKLLHEAIRTTRTISFELTPGILEDFGLTYALEELLRRIPRKSLQVQLQTQGLEEPLPKLLEVAVYRIVQELFNNIIKHAQAQEAFIYVEREADRLSVTVEDDGQGFDDANNHTPRGGIGLPGLRNRISLLGGTFNIASRPGQGTIITIELPVR
jgi:PAS domain S-box-containing protein